MLEGITGLDVLGVEDTETGLYWNLRNMEDGFATDTHKKIHKFSDGTIIKQLPESQLGSLTGQTGLIGITGIQGETGIQGIQGTTGAQGTTGVLDYVNGTFTGHFQDYENSPVNIEYVLIKNKIVHLKISPFTRLIDTDGDFYRYDFIITNFPPELFPTTDELCIPCPQHTAFIDNDTWVGYPERIKIRFDVGTKRMYFDKIPNWSLMAEPSSNVRGLDSTICISYFK